MVCAAEKRGAIQLAFMALTAQESVPGWED